MSENVSLVTQTYDPVRAILGDFSTVSRRYEDSAIASVVRTVLRLGKVPGYTLTADQLGITPAITTPKPLALLIYNAAKTLLLPNVAEYSYRTRAISERFGSQKNFLFDLENALYDEEHGEMFYTWQMFYGWVHSVTGINLWELLTEVKFNTPVATVTIGPGGIHELAEPPAAPPGVAVYTGSADPNDVPDLAVVETGSIYNQIIDDVFTRQWIKAEGAWQ